MARNGNHRRRGRRRPWEQQRASPARAWAVGFGASLRCVRRLPRPRGALFNGEEGRRLDGNRRAPWARSLALARGRVVSWPPGQRVASDQFIMAALPWTLLPPSRRGTLVRWAFATRLSFGARRRAWRVGTRQSTSGRGGWPNRRPWPGRRRAVHAGQVVARPRVRRGTWFDATHPSAELQGFGTSRGSCGLPDVHGMIALAYCGGFFFF
jgi:hypothetical protein